MFNFTLKTAAIVALLLFLFHFSSSAQKNVTEPMEDSLNEAALVTRLEIAGILANIHFGYTFQGNDSIESFAYEAGEDTINVIYFKLNGDNILKSVTITDSANTFRNGGKREFNNLEIALRDMYLASVKKMSKDSLPTVEEDMILKYLPIISDLGRKCYIVARCRFNTKVIFGLDNQISFNKKNEIIASSGFRYIPSPIDFLDKTTKKGPFYRSQDGSRYRIMDIVNAYLYCLFYKHDHFCLAYGDTIDVIPFPYLDAVMRWSRKDYLAILNH